MNAAFPSVYLGDPKERIGTEGWSPAAPIANPRNAGLDGPD